jgi:5'-nucleotidase
VNVNFPHEPKGLSWTRQAVRHYDGRVVPDEDPDGRKVYWLSVRALEEVEEGTDLWAVRHGLVSLTPLRLDLTDHVALEDARARWSVSSGGNGKGSTEAKRTKSAAKSHG